MEPKTDMNLISEKEFEQEKRTALRKLAKTAVSYGAQGYEVPILHACFQSLCWRADSLDLKGDPKLKDRMNKTYRIAGMLEKLASFAERLIGNEDEHLTPYEGDEETEFHDALEEYFPFHLYRTTDELYKKKTEKTPQ